MLDRAPYRRSPARYTAVGQYQAWLAGEFFDGRGAAWKRSNTYAVGQIPSTIRMSSATGLGFGIRRHQPILPLREIWHPGEPCGDSRDQRTGVRSGPRKRPTTCEE
jgi:hypothetical protein